MRRTIGIYLAICAIALSTSVFVAVVWTATSYASDPEVSAPVLEQAKPTESVPYPLRLRIPAIKVDANIKQVGVNEKGNMATPGNFTDVGWYKYGTKPGGRGSAVMAGHLNNALGLDGVFANLNKTKIRDDIYVMREDGSGVRFTVMDIQSYPYDQTPTDAIFNTADGVYLNLITCGGKWLQEKKTYDQRLIVFAKLTD